MTEMFARVGAQEARGIVCGVGMPPRRWFVLAALVGAACSGGTEPGPEFRPTEDAGRDVSADSGSSGAESDGGSDAEFDGGSVDPDAGSAADAETVSDGGLDVGLGEDAGTPVVPDPTWEEIQLESSRMALDGIVRYVGSHYQSCAPLLYLDRTPTRALVDHFGLPSSHTVADQCIDRREADFRYLSFVNGFEDLSDADGETSLDPNAGRMGLVSGEMDSFRRVHCTGALTGTMVAGRMKFHVGQTDRGFSPNTTELEELIQAGDHCFESPTMTRSFSLLPGDIINVSAVHAVRVFRVGEDPLGLGRVESVEDCGDIRTRNLDFHFVHSTSNDFYSGVHLQHTSDVDTPSLIRTLVQAVREMCRESFRDGEIRGEIPDLDLGGREFLGGLVVRERRFRVLRHVGPRVAECVWEPEVPVRGDDCLQESCYEQVVAAGTLP